MPLFIVESGDSKKQFYKEEFVSKNSTESRLIVSG